MTDQPIPPGKHELTPQIFADRLKSQPPEAVHQLNLKDAFANVLTASGHLPRLAEIIWRRVLDEAVSEFGGAYALKAGTVTVDIWLEKIPASAANAKIPTLVARMKDIHQKAHDAGPEVNLDQLFVTAPGQEEKSGISPEMTRLMQHGLTPNPSPEILDFWMTRTAQTILMQPQKTPMVKDIMHAVLKSDIAYAPVWSVAGEMLMGAWPYVKTAIPQNTWTAAEPVRQDLVGFFSSCLQLTVLAGKNIHAVGFLHLYPATLQNKAAIELLIAFLATLAPDVKKNLMIELRGLPKGMPSLAVKSALHDLSPHIKAYMVDTGPFAKDDYSNDIPRLYACGYDLTGLGLPEPEMVALIKRYAENYKNRSQKLYIKGVASAACAQAAREAGYAYLSGPAIHAPEKMFTGMRRHEIRKA